MLRRAFDQSFAEPRRVEVDDAVGLLAIRVADDGYGLRLEEVAGLFADRKIIRVPSPLPELLGLAGLRREVVPVYGLRGLLGYPSASDPPRWLVLVRASLAFGLAFDQFEGYLRVPVPDLLPSRSEAARPHVEATARVAEGIRGVVSVRSALEAVRQRVSLLGPAKEQ